MKTSLDPQDTDRALRHLGKLARATFTDELDARAQAGFGSLQAKLEASPRPRRFLTLGIGLAAAVAAVLPLALWWNQPPNLSFRVVDAASVPLTTVDSACGGRIEFSEGSQVSLDAETRASVIAIDARGARIRLESGRLSTRFMHLPKASWSIAAGPFQVLVTGTTFDVSWTPNAKTLELWMSDGSVTVKGPNTGQGLTLVAGQHLLASATSGQIVLDALVAAPALPAAHATTDPAPPSERPQVVPREPAPRPAPTARANVPKPTLGWPQSLARGEFKRILEEAAHRGFDEVLASANSADLAAFADAARYGRKNDLARQAFLAQRQRFAQTLAGRDAAFFLGTIDESRSGHEAQSSALAWYGRYLAENPNGSYGGQALGRRLVLFDSLHDRAAARETAATYLAKYPGGPYAAKAKRILESAP
jgi:ferric-dicitrate binding protein FerR (iron transport regulator)